jgi:MinD-like ATPase involved in chromosome partitioning or flagellar assembly
MSSIILFTAGAKGGSGKSTAVRFLVTYLREHGANPLLMDLDDENKTLSRFFPEAFSVGIKKKSSHDVLVHSALGGQYPLILADLKAGTGREVLEWFLDVPFDELRASQVTFVCIGSITSSPDSVQSFLNWVGELGDQVSYLVFKNLKDGETLPDYEDTHEAIQFRKQLNPAHVTIPRLDEEYQTELERLNLTISEIIDSDQLQQNLSAWGKPLGNILPQLLVRARLRNFQRRIYQQLDDASDLFFPAQSQKGKGIAHG